MTVDQKVEELGNALNAQRANKQTWKKKAQRKSQEIAYLRAINAEFLSFAKHVIGAHEDDTWDGDRDWLVETARAVIATAKRSADRGGQGGAA